MGVAGVVSTLTVYPDVEQRTDQWFAQRLGMVTASIVGGLLTNTLRVADNDTSRGITRRLVAERITGVVEETPMTSDMFRGVMLEPYARDLYADHAKVTVTECGFMVRDYACAGRLGYSPDGLVGDDGLVEIKCPRAKTHLATILADDVPAHYMAQLQTGLLVSDRKWIDYVSFAGGMPLYVKRVTPDQEWQTAILAALDNFEANAADMQAAYLTATDGLPIAPVIDTSLEIE